MNYICFELSSCDNKGGPPPCQGNWAARNAVTIILRSRHERQSCVVLRDSRTCVRDFCATFRRNDMEPWGRKLARRAFAVNEINNLQS